ncbi:MAG: Na/Pi symporter [Magnetococcus sp. WYHC-3]
MLRWVLLAVVFSALAGLFYLSPEFKEIAAGVGIFLFGMLFLEQGFHAFTGGALEHVLRHSTDRMWKSIAFGVVTTTLMQSSSLVSVIAISFLSAGMLDLVAGIGIIYGANVGTTTGAWLIAGFGMKVDIAAYAMPMLAFGVILEFQDSRSLKGLGRILAGMGFLFLGIHFMKSGFDSFRAIFDLSALAMTGYGGVLLFTLVGMVATVVMQSSHATLVLIITALGSGQLTYENALALAIGANVGTTITAIIGALGANVAGRQLAAAHLLFNLLTGALAILLIYQLVDGIEILSRWLDISPDDATLKLALFHTLFNLMGVALMGPLTTPLVRGLRLMFPAPARVGSAPRHLNASVAGMPATLTEGVRQEVLHLYDHTADLLLQGLSLPNTVLTTDQDLVGSGELEEELNSVDLEAEYERRIKPLYSEIVAFISRHQGGVTPERFQRLFELRVASREMVQVVKDIKHMRKNISAYHRDGAPVVRQEYRRLRAHVAEQLRDVDRLRRETSDGREALPLLALDANRATVEEWDVRFNENLDRLIRDGLIDPDSATSLMNDSTYATHLCRRLVDVAETLFVAHGAEQHRAQVRMKLDDADWAEVRQRAVQRSS